MARRPHLCGRVLSGTACFVRQLHPRTWGHAHGPHCRVHRRVGTVSSEETISGIGVGEWAAVPVSALADNYCLMSVRAGAGNTSAQTTVRLNGVCVDTPQFGGAGSDGAR